jgi:hypothetical protein
MEFSKLLTTAKDYSLKYLKELPEKRVSPSKSSLSELDKLSFKLPEASTNPE